jgi:hypothetical protein
VSACLCLARDGARDERGFDAFVGFFDGFAGFFAEMPNLCVKESGPVIV